MEESELQDTRGLAQGGEVQKPRSNGSLSSDVDGITLTQEGDQYLATCIMCNYIDGLSVRVYACVCVCALRNYSEK